MGNSKFGGGRGSESFSGLNPLLWTCFRLMILRHTKLLDDGVAHDHDEDSEDETDCTDDDDEDEDEYEYEGEGEDKDKWQ